MFYNKAYASAPYNNSLNYSTNNQYKRFPPKMSDSRSIVASSQPISVNDFYLNKESTNWGYREFLSKNAVKVQNEQMYNALNDIGYYKRFVSPKIPETSASGFTFSSLFDSSKPFGYQNSDLKQSYLSKEQLNARLMMPKINL